MFSEKNIVVTIGNYGAVVALHNGSEIKDKIFLEDLDDKSQGDLKNLFVKNKSLPIYLMLDTIDQSYKKKIYPPVRKGDLMRIIKRDMSNDSDQDNIKNYIIFDKKLTDDKQKITHRWECLFISSTNSPTINKWLEFLMEMPNRLVGIYMLPIETFNLFKLLKGNIKTPTSVSNNGEKKENLYCFVMQNKVSGIRQVVFSDHGIVFTRIVNYNFDQNDFLEKYEQDIYSTFEYLKRLFPTLSIANLEIVNIFPTEILDQIKKLQNIELSVVNYTPFQVASEAGYGKILSQKSSFCDLLISKIFSEKKKILKFSTPRISTLEKFFLTLKSSYYLNLGLVVLICGMSVFSVISQSNFGESFDIAETQKFSAIQELTRVKIAAFNGEISENEDDSDVSKIMDFGKMEESLGSVGINFVEFYNQLKFLKDFYVKLDGFSYSVDDFKAKSPSLNLNYKINLTGEILNKTGDIENLFKEFDSLSVEIKKNLNKNEITYSELPKDIDFNKKYYSFPIDFSISNKK
jgi:hypothetical protein